ncbi:hypothetical protein HGM15179_019190, partial [Zosterops borbonicus]
VAPNPQFPSEVNLRLNLGKTSEVFHQKMGLKMSLKNQDSCKQHRVGMTYTSSTSSVLEKNSIDENPKEGIPITPGSGINRDPRHWEMLQERRFPSDPIFQTLWPIFATCFINTWLENDKICQSASWTKEEE